MPTTWRGVHYVTQKGREGGLTKHYHGAQFFLISKVNQKFDQIYYFLVWMKSGLFWRHLICGHNKQKHNDSNKNKQIKKKKTR